MPTILHRFYENASLFGPSTCFMVKKGHWAEMSWKDVLKDVSGLARGLKILGMKKGETAAIFSGTRYEWTVIDLAILSVGAVTVPIYSTLSIDQIIYILNHSAAKVIFVESIELLEKIKSVRKRLTSVEKIVLIEGDVAANGGIIKFSSLILPPLKGDGESYKELIAEVTPDDVATCVYTSGTTGEPKGAEITHANIMAEVTGLKKAISFDEGAIGLLFLPLAHVVARAMQFYQLANRCITAYAESVSTLPENIIEVRPHFMVVVPRVMEKIHAKIMEEVAASFILTRKLFKLAVNIGMDVSERRRRHINVPFHKNILDRFIQGVVLSKLHKKLGGRLEVVVSGGAPLSKTLAEFFHAVGVLILEGYGLTETIAAITINRPEDFKFGTVGKPLEGTQIRIAPDGDVLVKGPQVFRGYRQPVGNADGDALEDGWFNTGDIGEFSRDGFLRITGRRKELIVTSSGKNISPQRVERVIGSSPLIREVVVYGDRQSYLSALIVPNYDKLRELANKGGMKYDATSGQLNNKHTYELIKSEIECKNRLLARHETVKKFVILDHDFSQEGGELTPTLKLKRQKIYEKYKDVIEGMYK